MYCHWGLTYFPYLEPVLTRNCATLVWNKLFPRVNGTYFRVGNLDLLIAWIAFVILSMDVTSVPFALNDLFRVHGNGQSQLSSSSKSTIASAKAQQQMNNWMYLHWCLTYIPYSEPFLTLNCATLVSNKLFPRVKGTYLVLVV